MTATLRNRIRVIGLAVLLAAGLAALPSGIALQSVQAAESGESSQLMCVASPASDDGSLSDAKGEITIAKPKIWQSERVGALLEQFPNRRFILVGDSGQSDSEAYGALARRFPKQVKRILIRSVPGSRRRWSYPAQPHDDDAMHAPPPPRPAASLAAMGDFRPALPTKPDATDATPPGCRRADSSSRFRRWFLRECWLPWLLWLPRARNGGFLRASAAPWRLSGLVARRLPWLPNPPRPRHRVALCSGEQPQQPDDNRAWLPSTGFPYHWGGSPFHRWQPWQAATPAALRHAANASARNSRCVRAVVR